ncbi:DUF2764 domain-containing protein [Bacteroides sp. 214]|uniref:DUF2764 family protein n=1 Tax=Bacteroides sp. 214 TaxID=2302935 RepID=UPI0013D223A1|nr:DUF2764 family protein [Bacteroides sp. 214]NDW12648.1 DUF2764 domain-containing protein [Bacteroides sp. 214]
MANYYYLVASLPDVHLDDGKLSYTVETFKEEVYPSLSETDRKLIDLLYLKYDNENLLKLLKDKEAVINMRGNYTAEELTTLIHAVKEGDAISNLPAYLALFLSEYFQDGSDLALPENLLAQYYYDYAMQSNNDFVAAWFEFNLNTNNVLAALMARKYKLDVAPNVVGQTEICDAIRTSTTRDFGLSGELIYFDDLVRIGETVEMVEKEKKIDALKWNWLEDESFFNYFTIEKLFVFLLKLEMVERWISLDKETGNQLFRKLIGSLKEDVQIPAEFR